MEMKLYSEIPSQRQRSPDQANNHAEEIQKVSAYFSSVRICWPVSVESAGKLGLGGALA